MNIRKIKNYASYFLCSFLPLITFITTILSTMNFFVSVIISAIIIIPSIAIGRFLSKSPMRMIEEGEGLLAIDFSSRGVVIPYIARINNQYINIKVDNSEINDLYSRDKILALEIPKETNARIIEKDGEKYIVIKYPEKKHYFVFERFYPTLFINTQGNFIYDRETLGELEIKYITKYTLKYIKTKTEELSSILRDFARYVLETLKPRKTIFSNTIFWIVIAIVFVLIALTILGTLPNIIGGGTANIPKNTSLITPIK